MVISILVVLALLGAFFDLVGAASMFMNDKRFSEGVRVASAVLCLTRAIVAILLAINAGGLL